MRRTTPAAFLLLAAVLAPAQRGQGSVTALPPVEDRLVKFNPVGGPGQDNRMK